MILGWCFFWIMDSEERSLLVVVFVRAFVCRRVRHQIPPSSSVFCTHRCGPGLFATLISTVFHHHTGGRPAVSSKSNPKTIFLTKSYTPRYRYRKKEYANHLPEPGVVIRDLIAIQAIFVDLVARFRQGVLLLLMKVAKVYNGGRTTGAGADPDVVLRATRTLSLVRSLLENMQGIVAKGQPADWVEWQNDVQWAFVAPYLSQLAFLEAQKSWCTVNTNQRLESRVTLGLINYDKSPAGISCGSNKTLWKKGAKPNG